MNETLRSCFSVVMGGPQAHVTLGMTCSGKLAKKARNYGLAMQGLLFDPGVSACHVTRSTGKGRSVKLRMLSDIVYNR